MTMTNFNTSQTNTDAGLNIATDYQRQQQGDQIPDTTMAEVTRRLVLAIFEAGFQEAITEAIANISQPEEGIGISDSSGNLIRSDNSGDVLLEAEDIPFPLTQTQTAIIGGDSDDPQTVSWGTAFPDSNYQLSVIVKDDISASGRIWYSKFNDRIEINWAGIADVVSVECFAHAVENE